MMSKVLKFINKSVFFMGKMADLVFIVSSEIQYPIFFFVVFYWEVFYHFVFYS